ncbi:restriction endonuclease subunit S [Flavobacteriaceae bacterium]|nr:restriction endonuclease subunit S [Flavobacteriaceae bacterium]
MREDWIECSLIEGCDIHDNLRKPINSRERNDRINGKSEDELFPYYGATGQVGFIDDYLTNGNYVLIGEDAAPFLDYSKDVAYKISGKTWVNNHAHILKSKFNDSFLLHYLNNFNYKNYISGTTRLKLTQGRLKQIPIKIAPLPEQRAIVAKIEELFSDLDKGIADLKKAQDQLKIYRQAVLKKAFEGELTKEWRDQQIDLPTADELLGQIKEERQKHYEQQLENWKQAVKVWGENGKEGKKPAKPKFLKELKEFTDEDLSELLELDSYWKWVKVDKLCQYDQNAMKAGPFGSSLKKAFYTDSGYKIYGQEQVISGDYKFGNYYVNEDKYQSLINCAVKPNDVLISLVGTVGKVLILPDDCEEGLINPRLVKFSLNDFYSEQFFKYFFESGFIKSIYKLKNHGTTMDVLNLGIIKELPFPLCSKKEQHQIVQEIETRLSVCDKVEESITESLEKAKALRQSILKKAFEGTLLSEQEIAAGKAAKDYEPASVLLEKIKMKQ